MPVGLRPGPRRAIETAGVGWYVPDDVLLSGDQSRDVTMTAVGYRPRVQVLLPGEYRPDGFPNTGGRDRRGRRPLT